jgi:DedD protein
MDRRVKERLIGASILVLIIVLVVPELLSGPKTVAIPHPTSAPALDLPASAAEPVRNVTVDLATSKPLPEVEPGSSGASSSGASGSEASGSGASGSGASGRASTAEPAGASAASAADPAATQAPAGSAAAPPAPTQGEPAAGPQKSLESTPPHPISGHDWAVQLGSFGNRANADKLLHRVKAQGFSAYVLAGGSGSAQRFRVRIGPLADRPAADRTIAKLKTMGYVASIVDPAH